MSDARRGTVSASPIGHAALPEGASRIWGIDLARFLAVIGMMATHVWSHQPDGSPTLIDGAVSGKAAALFALLAGVGISRTTRADSRAGRFGAARANVAGRGIALIVIGLTLGLAPGPVVVILVYYGAVFLAVVPLLRLSSPILLSLAGGLAGLWPPFSSFVRTHFEQPYDLGSASWLSFADPMEVVRGLFFTGMYPVPTWIVYVLVGIVVGRSLTAASDAGLRRVALRLCVVGAFLAAAATALSLAVAGPITAILVAIMDDRTMVETAYFGTAFGAPISGDALWLLSPAPHSGTLFDLAITTGWALIALGLTLAVGSVLPDRAKRLLEPLRATGAAPLTVYTAHVLAVSVVSLLAATMALTEMPWFLSSAALWGLHIAGALAIGAVLASLQRRGPLEALVTAAGRRAASPWRARR